MNKQSEKQHIVIDIGPITALFLSEICLIVLKIMNYINFSWIIILSPILLVVFSAFLTMLYALFKLIKNNIF